MCRFLLFKGKEEGDSVLLEDLIVRPSHGIISQSFSSRERTVNAGLPPELNADGFGVGWYLPESARAADAREPLEEDSMLLHLASTRSVTRGPRSGPSKPAADSHAPNGDNTVSHSPGSSPSRSLHLPPRVPASRQAGMFTSVTPAWSNRNLRTISSQIRSPLVFAHVRAAALGDVVSDQNCHPFVCNAHRHWMFMHNGAVAKFSRIRRRLLAELSDEAFGLIYGNTDSEHCFALFIHLLSQAADLSREVEPRVIESTVTATIARLNEWCVEEGTDGTSLLNFMVTDGRTVVATRYASVDDRKAASLYYASGSEWAPSEPGGSDFRMLHRQREERVVIVASERLSSTGREWVEVPNNSMVTVTPEQTVLLKPIEAPSVTQLLRRQAAGGGAYTRA